MPPVTLEIPRLLSDCTAGRTRLALDAERLDQAFTEIRRHWPTLGTHVFTEAGDLRPHVLLLHNDRLTRWMPGLDVPLAVGDRLTILQAVSGG